jgi:predicted ArsR family transcriptional regulator
MLALLRDEGPSTATRLAERLGLNTGATSYHLRQLDNYGFIVEEQGRGTGRERWWRAAHQTTRSSGAELGDEEGELTDAYLRSLAAMYADSTQRAIDEWQTLPASWRGAGTLSDFALRLTPEELKSLVGEFLQLLSRYRRHDASEAPEQSLPVIVQLQAFPRPGQLFVAENS